MTQRSNQILNRKFKEYLFPTILSSLSVTLGVVIDGIIVGNLISTEAMSAVNITDPILLFFQAVFFLFGMGGATLVAVSKGEHNNEKADGVFSISIFLLLGATLIITIVGLVFLDPLVHLICNDESLYGLVKDFSRILIGGSGFIILVSGMVYFIRVDGQPKLSASILVLSNIVNLCLDIVYIKFFNLGIQGAALATVTGYVIGFLLVLKYWFSKERTLKLREVKKKEWVWLRDLTGNGLAGTVNTGLLFTKTLCINRIVLTTAGSVGMAAFTVCNFSLSVVSLFILGASETMVPIIGILYGEKDWQGIRFIMKKTFRFVIIAAGFFVLLSELFPAQILMIFGIKSPEEIEMGILALRIFVISLFGMGLSFTMMYYLQTIGHRKISVVISILRGFVLIIPVAWFLSKKIGITGVWWAYVLAETLTIVIVFILCKRIEIRSKEKYDGILLFEKIPQEEKVFDVTIHNQLNEVISISDKLIRFGIKSGIGEIQSTFLGLMAEEAAINIMENNSDPIEIDIFSRIKEDEIIISFRDDGNPLNPLIFKEEKEEKLNIKVIKEIAKSVEYSRNLGMNTTIIKLRKEG